MGFCLLICNCHRAARVLLLIDSHYSSILVSSQTNELKNNLENKESQTNVLMVCGKLKLIPKFYVSIYNTFYYCHHKRMNVNTSKFKKDFWVNCLYCSYMQNHFSNFFFLINYSEFDLATLIHLNFQTSLIFIFFLMVGIKIKWNSFEKVVNVYILLDHFIILYEEN